MADRITFSGKNLPPGEYLAWLHRDNGTAMCLGAIERTTYGKWRYSGAAPDRHRDITFSKFAEAKAFVREQWT